MRTYLMALGFEIWSVVKNGYTTPITPPVDTTRKQLSDNNVKSMNDSVCSGRLIIYQSHALCFKKKDVGQVT
jgi:hypothetical protein